MFTCQGYVGNDAMMPHTITDISGGLNNQRFVPPPRKDYSSLIYQKHGSTIYDEEMQLKMVNAIQGHETQFKHLMSQMGETTKNVDTLARLFQEQFNLRTSAGPSVRASGAAPTTTYATSGDMPCFTCSQTGHLVKDSPKQKEMLEKGLIRFNDVTRLFELRDSGRLSWSKNAPGHPSRYDRIMELAKQKGWLNAPVDPQSAMFFYEPEPVEEVYNYSWSTSTVNDDPIAQQLEALEMELQRHNAEKSKN